MGENTVRNGRRLLLSVYLLLSLAGAALSGGCTAAQAERAVEAQRSAVEAIRDEAAALRSALASLRANIDLVAAGEASLREAIGPVFDELPPDVRATLTRVADGAGSGIEAAESVAVRLDAALGETIERGAAALAKLDAAEAALAEAETKEERFFELLDLGVGVGLTLLFGAPAGVVMARRARRNGAVEVAGAVSEGLRAPAGGINTLDLADVDTRQRIGDALGDSTKRDLTKAGVKLEPIDDVFAEFGQGRARPPKAEGA